MCCHILICLGVLAEPLLPAGTQSCQLVENRLPVPESAWAPSTGGTCSRTKRLPLCFMPGDMCQPAKIPEFVLASESPSSLPLWNTSAPRGYFGPSKG